MALSTLTYREFGQIIDQFDQRYFKTDQKSTQERQKEQLRPSVFIRYLETTDEFARTAGAQIIYERLPTELVARIALSYINCVADLFMICRTPWALTHHAANTHFFNGCTNKASKRLLKKLNVDVPKNVHLKRSYFNFLTGYVMYDFIKNDTRINVLENAEKYIFLMNKVDRAIQEGESENLTSSLFTSLRNKISKDLPAWIGAKKLPRHGR